MHLFPKLCVKMQWTFSLKVLYATTFEVQKFVWTVIQNCHYVNGMQYLYKHTLLFVALKYLYDLMAKFHNKWLNFVQSINIKHSWTEKDIYFKIVRLKGKMKARRLIVLPIFLQLNALLGHETSRPMNYQSPYHKHHIGFHVV